MVRFELSGCASNEGGRANPNAGSVVVPVTNQDSSPVEHVGRTGFGIAHLTRQAGSVIGQRLGVEVA